MSRREAGRTYQNSAVSKQDAMSDKLGRKQEKGENGQSELKPFRR